MNGVEIQVDFDTDGGAIFTETTPTAGLQRHVDEAAAEYRFGDLIGNTQRHVQRVAEIPLSIVADLMRRGIWRDDKAMRRWLNDPDNRCFRTGGGRV